MAERQSNINEFGVDMTQYAPNENNIFNRTWQWLQDTMPSGDDITETYGESTGGSIREGGDIPDTEWPGNPFLLGQGDRAAANFTQFLPKNLLKTAIAGSKWTPFQNIKGEKGIFGKEAGFGSGKGKLSQMKMPDRQPRKEKRQSRRELEENWNPVDYFDWTKEYGDYADRNKAAYEMLKNPEETGSFWLGDDNKFFGLGKTQMDDWDARDEYGFKVTPEQFKKTLETKFGEMKSPKQKRLDRKAKVGSGLLGFGEALQNMGNQEAYKYDLY